MVLCCPLTIMCVCFQSLTYDSSTSLYQQEDGSPALASSTQSGVKNKVSAWLQQTQDVDATSNGQNHLYSWLHVPSEVTECLSGFIKMEERKCCECTVWIFLTFCVSELTRCQQELTELAQLIQRLHWLEGGLPVTSTDLDMRISMHVSMEKVFKGNVMF